MVTCFGFGVAVDVRVAFGHALGGLGVCLLVPVGYCRGCGCQGPTRDFLAASAPTAVVLSITSIIAAEYTTSTLEWQQSERFTTPIVRAV